MGAGLQNKTHAGLVKYHSLKPKAMDQAAVLDKLVVRTCWHCTPCILSAGSFWNLTPVNEPVYMTMIIQ